MTKNKNMEVQDEAMEQANGGMTLDDLNNHGIKKYHAFGTVVRKVENETSKNACYLVRKEDGAEIQAWFYHNHIVPEGTQVALIMLCGGWIMEELRFF